MKKILYIILGLLFVQIASADTETLTWYVDNNVYDTTTCESGDDVILPTPPTRYGYTFHGWESFFDISTLDTTINGQVLYSRSRNGVCHRLYFQQNYESRNCSLAEFSDLEPGQFKVVFEYGTIYGVGLCSSAKGVSNTVGVPDQTTGGPYTWYRIIKFVNNQDGLVYEQPNSPWVYHAQDNYCSQGCALNSGGRILQSETHRTVAYGL